MAPALVTCLDCERTWHSATMAEGLRDVGCCPRCSGTLEFAAPAEDVEDGRGGGATLAPHLVLGVPRR